MAVIVLGKSCEFLLGMSLNDSSGNDALIAGDAKSTLGNNLDAMLWGNVRNII